jgi:hypothetical protein
MWSKVIYILLLLSTFLVSQDIVKSDRIRWIYGNTNIRPENPTVGTFYFNTDSTWFQYWDGTQWIDLTGISIVIDSTITIFYPIPIDSLVDSTFTVIADSGVGGGGTANLGDTLYIRNHVDGVTIDIFQDTLRVDTTKLATQYYVNDTLSAYWDTTNVRVIVRDSSQYYHWRAKSKYRFPEYDDMVLWDYNDFQTAQDSVDVCYFVEYTTNYNYLLVERDAAASDSQYIHLHWTFVAPRNVSDITDTLFIFRYKTTSVDTMNCGALPIIVEGTTVRYKPTEIVASTAWDTIAVLKSYGTLNLITEGDQFSLDIRFKVDGDSCFAEMLEERWY